MSYATAMPKQIEPTLTGDKFVLVGIASDLAGLNNDFFQIASTSIIQPFGSDDLWHVTPSQWKAEDAKKMRQGEDRYIYRLSTSEYVIVREEEIPAIVGTSWLNMLKEIAPELATRFDDWKTEEGKYSFRYNLATIEEHKAFNTELSEHLEAILIASIKSNDEKTIALSHHLYESASIYSNVPYSHSILVTGAYCSVADADYGLPLIESIAKTRKLYRNHKKWQTALDSYKSANGI